VAVPSIPNQTQESLEHDSPPQKKRAFSPSARPKPDGAHLLQEYQISHRSVKEIQRRDDEKLLMNWMTTI
jgi:hypothetical protein